MKRPFAVRAWPRVALALVGFALASCAKQQASEPAATEAAQSPERKKALDEAPDEADAEERAAPAPPAAAPGRGQGSEDLLDQRERAAPLDIDQAMAQLHRTLSELDRALMLSAPDCVTAASLRDRVCELAEHICRLADESGAQSAQELCGDGRGRCSEARKRYAESCAEP
jgi:hypothetical protein